TLWHDMQDEFDIVLGTPSGIAFPAPAVGTSESRPIDGASIEIARNIGERSTSVQTQIVIKVSRQAAFDGGLLNWRLSMTCRRAVVGRLDGWMAGQQLAKFRAGRMVETARTIGMPATANNVIAVASHVTKNAWTSGRGTEIAPAA